MIKSIGRNNSHTYRQNLLNEYEGLRILALKKVSAFSNNPSGFSILLFRGMTTWVETLSSELTYVPQENFHYSQGQISNSIRHPKTYIFSEPIHEEATRI